MFNKKKCESCGENFDIALDKCPKCNIENKNQPDEFKSIVNLKIWKHLVLFGIGWIGLQTFAAIIQLIYLLAYGPFESIEAQMEFLNLPDIGMPINSISYVLVFVALCLVLWKEITKLFKSFKNWKPYVAAAACFGAMMLFNFIYPLILKTAGVEFGNNQNESGLQEITQNYKFLSLLIFALIGPICEEITYRVGLFSFFKRINKWLAYGATILVFTLIHFGFGADDLINELINIPFYLIAAFGFTFIYDNFGFAASLTAHITNNFISLTFAAILGYGAVLL